MIVDIGKLQKGSCHHGSGSKKVHGSIISAKGSMPLQYMTQDNKRDVKTPFVFMQACIIAEFVDKIRFLAVSFLMF